MKECNLCSHPNCTPRKNELMSILPCPQAQVQLVGKWPFPDCVSKVTIKNPNNPVISLLRNI